MPRRIAKWVVRLVSGVISVGLLLVGAVAVLASTPFGMEQARRIGLGFLRDNINGRVDVARVSGDGLLRGMVLHDVVITDSAGQPFARADSFRVRYGFFEMLFSGFRRIVIGSASLYGADVRIAQMPGDSLFNVERIFGRDRQQGGGRGRLIRFDNVKLVSSRVEIVRDYGGRPAGDAAERFVIEDSGTGRIQVMRFELDGEVSRFLASDPGGGARELSIDGLHARALVLRQPVELHEIRGKVTIADSVIGIDVARVGVAGGHAAVSGRILRRHGETGYDLRVDAEDLALEELHRVEPRVPASGAAELALRLESQPNGDLLISVRDLAVRAPATNVTGTFGWLTGSRSGFRDVDLRIGALELTWLEHALRRELPLEGRLAGRVRAAGPLAAIRTSGELQLAGWGGAGEPILRWTGTVRADGPFAASALNTEVEALDLALVERIRPGAGLTGVVSGRVDLDGRLDESMQVRAVLRHWLDGLTSNLDGGGRIAMSDDVLSMDLAFDAQPFHLEVLGRMVEPLDSLHGPVRGRLAVRGWADNLDLRAVVGSPAGPLDLQATIDRRTDVPAYLARAVLRGFEPARIGLAGIDARVSGEVDLELRGTELGDMTGPVRATVDSATVLGYPVERARIVTALAGGRARVDSASFRALGVRGRATGGFGLVEASEDTLHVIVESESFEPLERLIFGQDVDPTSPRITGNGRANLRLRGSLADVALDADAVLDHFRVDAQSAAATRLVLQAEGLRTDSVRFEVSVAADSVQALDGFADSVRARFTRERTGEGRLLTHAWEAGASSIVADATFRELENLTEWRLADVRFRSGTGNWRLAEATTVELGGRSLRVNDLRLLPDQGGEISATGRLAWFDSTTVTAANTRVDFDIALRSIPVAMIPPALRPAGRAGGIVGGDIHIDSTAGAPVIEARLEAIGLEYESARLERVSIAATYRDRLLDARAQAFLDGVPVMNGEGAIPVDLRFGPVAQRVLPEPVNMTVRMTNFPAAFVLGLLPGFTDVEGTFPDGALEATGLARDPALRGALTMSDGAATVEATGVRYERVEGTLLMNEDLRAIVDFAGATVNPRNGSRSGTLRITGTVDLNEATDPGLDLELAANGILAALRRDMEITASAGLRIGGRYRRPLVTGDVSVQRGTIFLDELYRQYLIVQFEDELLFDIDTSDAAVTGALPERANPFIENLRIEDLQATATSGLWLRSREMNVELAGGINVDLDRQRESIVITGALEVIRGTYTLESGLLARSFQVQSGTVSFPGTPGMDPVFDITALYTARAGQEPLDIYADVTGSLSAPRVTLRSDIQPPISESDLASYLFFGAPTSHFGFAGSGSGVTGLLGGLGERALAGSALGYVASGLQTIGQSSGLVDYVGLTTAEAAPGGGAGLSNFLTGTRIELGRYITPRLFLLITQPLNSPAGADDPGIRLEWRLSRTITAEIFTDNRFARAPSIGLSQAIAARRVFGFFVFREWSY